MNEKNHHVVIVVGKGHGKMETMRQELGMSHEEFEENIKKKIKTDLEKEKERRKIRDRIMGMVTTQNYEENR